MPFILFFSRFWSAIPKGFKVLIFSAILVSCSAYVGSVYGTRLQIAAAKIQAAEETARMYKERHKINEKVDSATIDEFCRSMLGMSDRDAVSECVRRLGTTKTKSGDRNILTQK